MINLKSIIIIPYYVDNESVGTGLYGAISAKNNNGVILTLNMHLRGCYD